MNKDELNAFLKHPFFLFQGEFLEQLSCLNDKEFSLPWTKVATEPIEYDSAFEKAIYELNSCIQWYKVLTYLNCHQGTRVAEIGPGTSIILPLAITLSTQGDAEYTAVDPGVERLLELENRLRNLPISKRFIAANVGKLPQLLPSQSLDYIVGHHIINDLIETIVAYKQCLTAEPLLINERCSVVRLVSKLYYSGTLYGLVEKELSRQLRGCWYSLREGGLLLLNHFIFKLDIECGYPLELYSNLTGFLRQRFLDKEHWESLDVGLDPGKWLIVRKIE